jgi:hypothetical protein
MHAEAVAGGVRQRIDEAACAASSITVRSPWFAMPMRTRVGEGCGAGEDMKARRSVYRRARQKQLTMPDRDGQNQAFRL